MKRDFERNYAGYFLVYMAAIIAGYTAKAKKAICRRFNIEPNCNSMVFDGLGPKCRAVKEGAKSWAALHTLYNFPQAKYKTNAIGRIVDLFWLLGLKNPRGVRNRLKIVTSRLSEECTRLLKEKQTITILSLACGSAEAVLSAVASLGADKDRVHVFLLDQEQSALDYAQREADRLGVKITTTKSSVARIRKVFKSKADIVEMVGLLDYLDDGTATRVFEMIQDAMIPDGMFITANIIPNEEITFLRYCSDWEMIYREPSRLKNLCGFVFNSHVELDTEPLRIHSVAICRK